MVYIAVALTLTSLALYAAMMTLFVRAMMKRRRGICSGGPGPSRRVGAPPVTIFKPLAGSDDDLEGNLESFARIEYPSFEVLLGVANRADPAFGVARRFVARHPRLDARIVLTDPKAAVNPKVAQLVGLEAVAKGEVWVISDSNVRVRPSYLRTLVDELADDPAGLPARQDRHQPRPAAAQLLEPAERRAQLKHALHAGGVVSGDRHEDRVRAPQTVDGDQSEIWGGVDHDRVVAGDHGLQGIVQEALAAELADETQLDPGEVPPARDHIDTVHAGDDRVLGAGAAGEHIDEVHAE